MLKISRSTYPLAVAIRAVTRLWHLPQSPRQRLARLFFRFHEQPHYPFRVKSRGILYSGDFYEYLDWRGFFLGDFERESINLCELLSSHIRNAAFVDIGANKGLYSLVLARLFSKVWAFEPLAQNVVKFKRDLELNHIDNVAIETYALGAETHVAEFNAPPDGNEGIGSFLPLDDQIPSVPVTLPVRNGDEALSELGVTIGLAKIDVEGYEAFVLRGLVKTLARDRPFLVMEIGESSKAPLREAGGLRALLPPDYELFEISDHSTAERFFLKPLRDDELLTREITNNLACPKEKLGIVEKYVRQNWRWAKTQA